MLSIVRPVGTLVTAKLLPISPAESPRWSVSPRPSCPLELSPQQIRSLLSITAHVWLFPASIIVACRPVGNCRNGNVSPVSKYPSPKPPSLVEYPSPSTDDSPQHLTEPLVNSAQECLSPMTILSTDALVPRLTNGRSVPVSSELSPMFCVLPRPSCPSPPLPQHLMLPDAPIAHPDCNPNAIESALPVLPALMTICSFKISSESGLLSLDSKFWSANGVMGISTMISVNRRADVRSEPGRMTRARVRWSYSLPPIMIGLFMK